MVISIKQKIQTYKGHFTAGIGWLMGEQIIGTVFGLILTAVLANVLSPTEFGTYKYVLSVAGFLLILTVPGTNITIIRSIARGFHGSIADLQKFKLFWCFVATIVTVAVSCIYFYKGNSLIGSLMLIAGIGMPVTAFLSNYSSILHGYSQFRQLSITNIFVRVVHYGSIIIATISTKNILFIIATYYVSLAVAQLIALKFALTKVTKGTSIDPEARRFSNHNNVLDAFSILSQQIDKILLFQYIGAFELALYSIAITPPDILRGFMKNISSFLMPRMAKYQSLTFVQHIKNHVIPGSVIAMVLTALYIALAPFMIPFLFPQYSGAVYYSQIYALSLLAVTLYPQALMQVKGGIVESYIHKILSGTIRIVSIWIGLVYFGIIGVIWAQVISSFFTLVILLIMAKRVTK